jgi:hypothetical protein
MAYRQRSRPLRLVLFMSSGAVLFCPLRAGDDVGLQGRPASESAGLRRFAPTGLLPHGTADVRAAATVGGEVLSG